MSEYYDPTSIEDAAALLGQLGSRAAPLAGGTDLVVAARSGKERMPDELVALHRISDLQGMSPLGEAGFHIAAMASYRELMLSDTIRDEYSALADAATLVGSPATRHVATLGGNLCNGSPAMETGSPLLVLDAAVEVRSAAGSRKMSVRDFLVAPGRTGLLPGELLTGVTLPPTPAGAGSSYVRLEYRRGMEIAIVGAAAFVSLGRSDEIREARIALTAVAPACVRATVAESVLTGATIEPEILTQAAGLATTEALPISDVRAPASYRTAMIPVMVHRALEDAVRRARERA